MDLWAVLMFGFFYVVMFYVGLTAHKRLAKKKNSGEEFMLADRKLPLWLGLGTMTATWVGGGYINGTAEAVYAQGWIWAQAPIGYGLSLILGGLLFAGIMRRRKYASLLDPFHEKYGKKVTALLYIPAFTGDLFWSASTLAALGYTVSGILNISFATAVILSASIVIVYTLLGGLLAVAYTDFAQLMFILFGLTLVIPFAIWNAGGLDAIFQSYSQISFQTEGVAFPSFTWSDNMLLLILGGIPWGVYFQRILACPSEQSAKRLSMASGLICILFAIPPAILGMIGASTDWSAFGVEAPTGAMVLPYIFKYLTPYIVGLLGASVVAAGVMASVDSSILSASYMFVWNVLLPFRKDLRSKITGLTQFGVVIMGMLATALALQVQSVYALWYLCSDFVYVVLFPQLLVVLYVPFANARGAVAGLILAILMRCIFGEESLGVDPFFGLSTENVPFRTFCMLCSLVTIFSVSWFTRHVKIKNLEGDFAMKRREKMA